MRKPEEKPKRTRKKSARNSAANGNANGDVLADALLDGTGVGEAATPLPGPSGVHSMETYSVPMPLPAMTGVMGSVGGPGDTFNPVVYQPPAPVFQHMSMPTSGPMSAEIARQNAREEEMEDDEVEWQVREGNAPAPAWAKRKLADEEEEASKRQKTRFVSMSMCRCMWVTCSLSLCSPLEDPSTLHVIDQAVRDIAMEFRFLLEEVKEYYDKCGDAARTRNRFRKMREVLNALPDDEESPLV